MRTVKVSLGSRSYSISIGDRLLAELGRECARLKLGKRCAVVSDSNVAPLYADRAMATLEQAGFEPILITFPAGETSKNLKVFARCLDELAEHRLERQSFVVALGGGVVGDLAGFLAASYLRGIHLVQIPTTLLAQVDSSVGGKTGVNLKAGKNLVGAFWQPRLVLCDLDTLDTLPTREFQSGLAEVIKYGVIFDEGLFEQLELVMTKILTRDREVLATIIARCCQIKANVVSQDETESGLRAILNFGHTIGHGLEAISKYGKYLHGEAIAIGQVLAAQLSIRHLSLPQSDVDRIRDLLEQAGLPTSVSLAADQRQLLLQAMRRDKKVTAGVLKFVLANRIGKVSFGQTIAEQEVEKLLSDDDSEHQDRPHPQELAL